eukprot:m51a1_g14052 putative cytosolic carboxypeptidase 1 (1825) ;mRNA; r:1197061-1204516
MMGCGASSDPTPRLLPPVDAGDPTPPSPTSSCPASPDPLPRTPRSAARSAALADDTGGSAGDDSASPDDADDGGAEEHGDVTSLLAELRGESAAEAARQLLLSLTDERCGRAWRVAFVRRSGMDALVQGISEHRGAALLPLCQIMLFFTQSPRYRRQASKRKAARPLLQAFVAVVKPFMDGQHLEEQSAPRGFQVRPPDPQTPRPSIPKAEGVDAAPLPTELHLELESEPGPREQAPPALTSQDAIPEVDPALMAAEQLPAALPDPALLLAILKSTTAMSPSDTRISVAARLAGAVPPLLWLAQKCASAAEYPEAPEILEVVLSTLSTVTTGSDANCLALYKAGGIPQMWSEGMFCCLLSLFRSHPGDQKVHLEAALVLLLMENNLPEAIRSRKDLRPLEDYSDELMELSRYWIGKSDKTSDFILAFLLHAHFVDTNPVPQEPCLCALAVVKTKVKKTTAEGAQHAFVAEGEPLGEPQSFRAHEMLVHDIQVLHSDYAPVVVYDRFRSADVIVDSTSLKFFSEFESGNLGRAVRIAENEYELATSFDTNSANHTQWFYFGVSNIEKGATYKLNLVNMEKATSEFSRGLRPLVFSKREYEDTGRGWHRTGDNICYYPNQYTRDLQSKKLHYFTLTFTTSTQYESDTCWFAVNYPYTVSDLQEYLHSAVHTAGGDVARISPLCKTEAGNVCPLVTITDFASPVTDIRAREYVFVTARVHPGESGSSFIAQGVIDYLLSSTAEAQALRERYVFKIVPMLNPDGVAEGNHRGPLGTVDLNRVWMHPDSALHPTIFATKWLMQNNIFIYGCSPFDRENLLSVRLFPFLISKHASCFSFRNSSFRGAKKGSARMVVWQELRVLNSFTMEASFSGVDQGPMAGYHLNPAMLANTGTGICAALLHYDEMRVDPNSPQSKAVVAELMECSAGTLKGAESDSPLVANPTGPKRDAPAVFASRKDVLRARSVPKAALEAAQGHTWLRVAAPTAPEDEHRLLLVNGLFGAAVTSTYPQNTDWLGNSGHDDTRGRQGDPICDALGASLRLNRLFACLADPKQWGVSARAAASNARDAFLKHMETSELRKPTKHARKLAKLMLEALAKAHLCLCQESEEEGHERCATTLLGLAAAEGAAQSGEPAAGAPWHVVAVSVGDCKAYRVRRDGAVDEITRGENVVGVGDCGGKIGPAVDGCQPDTRNLSLFYCKVDAGDLLLMLSDGVHCNLDPERLGKSCAETASLLGVTRPMPAAWSELAHEDREVLKRKFAELYMQKLLRGATVPGAVCERLREHCFSTTQVSRDWVADHPRGRLPKDYTKFPGRMDHCSIVCLSALRPDTLSSTAEISLPASGALHLEGLVASRKLGSVVQGLRGARIPEMPHPTRLEPHRGECILSFLAPCDGREDEGRIMFLDDALACCVTSTYPTVANERQGDPICDTMAIATYYNRITAVIADGCNWGEAPRSAAHVACRAFLKYAQDTCPTLVDSNSIALAHLDSLAIAHYRVCEAMGARNGTTTLLSLTIAQCEETTVNEERWIAILCGVGDCKAFAVHPGRNSATRSTVEEITRGLGRAGVDASDCGGRIGPHTEDGGPDLRNMGVSFAACHEGDYIILASDGLHDNLDPEMLGRLPKEAAACAGYEDPQVDQWSSMASHQRQTIKRRFAEEALARMWDSAAGDPASFVDRAVRHCFDWTTATRQWIKDQPHKRVPPDYASFPGKPDHVSILCFRVGFQRPVAAALKVSLPKDATYPKPTLPLIEGSSVQTAGVSLRMSGPSDDEGYSGTPPTSPPLSGSPSSSSSACSAVSTAEGESVGAADAFAHSRLGTLAAGTEMSP